jgi:hypothetical protein
MLSAAIQLISQTPQLNATANLQIFPVTVRVNGYAGMCLLNKQ